MGLLYLQLYILLGFIFLFLHQMLAAAAFFFVLKHSVGSVTWLPQFESARWAAVQELDTEQATYQLL
jgi:hypothetical protein